MKVAIAQMNSKVGDIDGNIDQIKRYISEATENHADIIVFPELAITGYPPQDLLYHDDFLNKVDEGCKEIIMHSGSLGNDSPAIFLGTVRVNKKEKGHDGRVAKYNSALVIKDGKIMGQADKTLLPSYDVFDEWRYFVPSAENKPISLKIKDKEYRFGVHICEDLWDVHYESKVTENLADAGVNIMINLSASPYHIGKNQLREKLVVDFSRKHSVPFIYTNMVGGQDELIFDGSSYVSDKDGKIFRCSKPFMESLDYVELTDEGNINPISDVLSPLDTDEENIFAALVLGIKDYFFKNGFKKAVLGLSGGIDSALCAVLVTEALGSENVLGILMPSKFSSDHSIKDAELLAKHLGIENKIIPIQEKVDMHIKDHEREFGNVKNNVTKENIQARIRGDILMTISNDQGYIVIATGNKTEIALGYCTLYGDMVGGIAPLSDVDKKLVYSVSRDYNKQKGKEIIPKSSLEKPPSAELDVDQVDPFDYDCVVPFVNSYIEDEKVLVIKNKGKCDLREAIGESVELITKIDASEFKRRQATLGLKITKRAFGSGRRMPIVNGFWRGKK